MKNTLFLCSVLGLVLHSAQGADDALTPQTILNVKEGSSVTQDAVLDSIEYKNACEDETITTVRGALEQTQMGATTGSHNTNLGKSRYAVVKDGDGELKLNKDVALQSAFMVREGTVTITDGATVSNSLKSDGCGFSVSGTNARMVLDNGHYTTTAKAPAVCSASIGSLDGDGTLQLLNGSTFYIKQSIFTGNAGKLPLPEDPNPAWAMGPHYGGTYTRVDGTEGNTYYQFSSNAQGFSNPYNAGGVRTGTATIDVLSASKLETGYGFYVGNTTLRLSGEDSQINTGLISNADNVWIGSKYGITAKVNITDGGAWTLNNGQYLYLSFYDGQRSDVSISGEDSAMDIAGWGIIGEYRNTSTVSYSSISISDGGRMSIGENLYVHGKDGAHTLAVTGKNSQFQASSLLAESGSSIHVSQEASMVLTDNLELGKSGSATLSLTDGATASAALLYIYENGSMNIGKDSTARFSGANHIVDGTLINNGTIDNIGALFVFGTLQGSGNFGKTCLESGGHLVVGNSPGLQTYNGTLTLDAGIVEFSVDDLLNSLTADAETTGWGTHAYSSIDMQGNDFIYGQLMGGPHVAITLGSTALSQLAAEGSFELTLVQNIGNAAAFSDAVLATMLSATSFAGLNGESVISGVGLLNGTHYELRGNNLVLTNVVPEPATATLSLLALAALTIRRRRK